MANSSDDIRQEAQALARSLREHLEWLGRGGVSGLPTLDQRTAPAPEAAVARPSMSPPVTVPSQAKAPSFRLTPAPPADALLQVDARTSAQTVTQHLGGAPGLAQIREDLGDCRRCKLAGGRKHIVFGIGNPEAALVFIGEGPGEEEDLRGEPFVGKAGQLLDRMIVAMGLERSEVYICNVVKCRPPQNRVPEPDEVAACIPFLERQLAALRPRILVSLGKTASANLLNTSAPISKYRGRFQRYQGILLMPTYHPAYLLRTPSAKREAWEDLKLVMAELDRLGIPRRATPSAGA